MPELFFMSDLEVANGGYLLPLKTIGRDLFQKASCLFPQIAKESSENKMHSSPADFKHTSSWFTGIGRIQLCKV
jgi:hypothetical protein